MKAFNTLSRFRSLGTIVPHKPRFHLQFTYKSPAQAPPTLQRPTASIPYPPVSPNQQPLVSKSIGALISCEVTREKDPKPEEMLVVQGLQAAVKSVWKKHFYDPIGYTYVNTGGSTTLRSIEALRKETQALRKEGKERVKEVEEKLVAQKEAGEGKEAEELKKKQGVMEDWP